MLKVDEERAMVLAANLARRRIRLAEEAARGGNLVAAYGYFEGAAAAAGDARDLFAPAVSAAAVKS
jgi:hypothetical protein